LYDPAGSVNLWSAPHDRIEADRESRRTLSVDGVKRSIHVENEIDACIGQHLHALIVVLGVIDGVDTDGIEAEFLEKRDIASADLYIGDRVFQLRSTALNVG
jgi:hypothetical protein